VKHHRHIRSGDRPDRTVYYWDAERTDSNGRPISGEGDVRYKYELRHQTVAV
jgi:hypothetical protein